MHSYKSSCSQEHLSHWFIYSSKYWLRYATGPRVRLVISCYVIIFSIASYRSWGSGTVTGVRYTNTEPPKVVHSIMIQQSTLTLFKAQRRENFHYNTPNFQDMNFHCSYMHGNPERQVNLNKIYVALKHEINHQRNIC